MPRHPKNFDNAVIYKIVCKDIGVKDCYVGSTTNFTKRKCCHKSFCLNEKCKQYSYYVYKFIRENGGWDNWTMIEECKAVGCKDENELFKLEFEYYTLLGATLNTQRPTGKPTWEINKEQYEKNKENRLASQKEYHEAHKEERNEYTREHYAKTREQQLERKREYHSKNKEVIREKLRMYYQKNKARLLEQARLKYQENKEGTH